VIKIIVDICRREPVSGPSASAGITRRNNHPRHASQFNQLMQRIQFIFYLAPFLCTLRRELFFQQNFRVAGVTIS
jgi:hypothetical protein